MLVILWEQIINSYKLSISNTLSLFYKKTLLFIKTKPSNEQTFKTQCFKIKKNLTRHNRSENTGGYSRYFLSLIPPPCFIFEGRCFADGILNLFL